MAHKKIIRTSDGLQFSVETDEPYSRVSSDVGELVRSDWTDSISQAILKVSNSALQSIRHTGADHASINFGLSMSANGAVAITEGKADAHIVVTLEWSRQEANEPWRG